MSEIEKEKLENKPHLRSHDRSSSIVSAVCGDVCDYSGYLSPFCNLALQVNHSRPYQYAVAEYLLLSVTANFLLRS